MLCGACLLWAKDVLKTNRFDRHNRHRLPHQHTEIVAQTIEHHDRRQPGLDVLRILVVSSLLRAANRQRPSKRRRPVRAPKETV